MSSTLQLYELDSDPNRKDFLDDLFTFMQKRGELSLHKYPLIEPPLLDVLTEYLLGSMTPQPLGSGLVAPALHQCTY